MEVLPLMCRICEHQFNLIDISSQTNKNYLEMFLACANVFFRVDDQLPKHVCRYCCSRLVHAFAFKKQCEETQKKLQDLFASITHEIKDEFRSDNNLEDGFSDDAATEATNDEKDDKAKDKQKKQLDKKIRYKCDICRKTFRVKLGVEKHLRDCHSMAHNMLQCPYCEVWIKNKNKFRPHVMSHEKPFVCEHCSKRFPSMANKKRHIRTVHEKQKTYQCHHCDRLFTQKSTMQHHLESLHTSEPMYDCETCGESFKTSRYLYMHKKKHSPTFVVSCKKKNTKKIVCEFCGKLVLQLTYASSHIQTHNTDRPHKCLACDKSFKTKDSLYMHSQTHAERRYKCDLCDMAFVQSSHLKTHQMVHTGQKPFECEFCGKQFAAKNNCVTHMRLHTGEKPFKCKQCEECFIDLNGLKRHRNKFHE